MNENKPLPAAARYNAPCEPRAVIFSECPRPGKCKCAMCSWCGQRKHTAVHGPFYGQPDDGTSIPYQHEFNTGRKASASVKSAMVRASLSQGEPEGTPPQANPEISESRIQEGKQDA